MTKLTKKWQLILYGCSGLGMNLLNIIVGSYLCSALLVGGFDPEDIGLWTYTDRNLVVAGLWGALVLVSKIVDGIIDLPLSSLTDNLRTRWGRRRPALLMGWAPMVWAYLLFLFPMKGEASVGNTLWFALLLCVYYASYTLTMVTYYATFAEIVENDRDRVFLSNVKSVCDVVYFSLSFALVPVFVDVMGMNIRRVALLFLPVACTVFIAFFMIKEPSTVHGVSARSGDAKGVNLFRALEQSVKNRKFLYWMLCASVMNFGLQLFLSGINEYFSTTGLNMTVVMASSFAPVPFTLLLYNKLVKKRGLQFGFQYALLVYSAGMILMFFCQKPELSPIGIGVPEWLLTPVALLGGIIVSFAIGAFFSVSYTVPSQLAAEENARTGNCASSMYFAVEGLFEGVAAGLASGPMLVFLKEHSGISYMTLIIAQACLTAFVLTLFLPKSISLLGKETKTDFTEKPIFMTYQEKFIFENCKKLRNGPQTMEGVYRLVFSNADSIMTEDAALVGKASRKTYRQAEEEVERVARAIIARLSGESGRYIGLYGENKPAWMILFWAVLKSGNTPYLVNLRQPAEFAADALRTLGSPLTVCVSSAPDLGTPVVSYEELLASAPETAPEVPFGDGFVLSTSGTTLSKKMCFYHGRNIIAQLLNMEGVLVENPRMGATYQGRWKHLVFLPLYHIFGLEAVFLWFSVFGFTFVFPPDLNPKNLLRTIRDRNVTHIFAVPLLWSAVEKSLRKEASKDPNTAAKLEKGLKISRTLQKIAPKTGQKITCRLFRDVRARIFGESVQFCISGGSAVKESTLDLLNGIGYHLCNGFGMSEIGITSVDLSRRMDVRVKGSIGRPFASVEYRIDCDGRLLVRGDSLCSAMWIDGENCPMGDWFNTGDLMSCDENGRYYISGRASDLVFGEDGENLNPDLAEEAFVLTQAKNFTVTGDVNNEKLMLIVQVEEGLSEEQRKDLAAQIQAGNDRLPASYKIREVRYTYDPIMGPRDIKVSRARLRRQMKDGEISLSDTLIPRAKPVLDGESVLKRELRQMFAEILEIPSEKVTDDGHFMHDLGGSSLDYFTLISQIGETYGVMLEFEMENFHYTLADFERIVGEMRG